MERSVSSMGEAGKPHLVGWLNRRGQLGQRLLLCMGHAGFTHYCHWTNRPPVICAKGGRDIMFQQSGQSYSWRRTANYEESVWRDDYIQSLTTPYMDVEYVEWADEIKRMVQRMIDAAGQHRLIDKLELVDVLQRLNISYHFCDGVKKLLQSALMSVDHNSSLHAVALQFRLLRQHGHHVPQEVFCQFMDQAGNFQAHLAEDVKGILSLYDASFLSMEEGERILDLAKDFATHHLKQLLEQIADDSILANEIRHALELPLHWRVQKLEARWFIRIYQSRSDASPILLQLAKLDYNMVQAVYQDEIKCLSRWYEETGLTKKLGFARDRFAQVYLYALGITPEPHLRYARSVLCKVAILIVIIDDIYDVYGTLDELKLFTEAIQRWDIKALDQLPEYMRICFMTLFNSTNEMAYNIMRDQGINVISHLNTLWAELCRTFYVEAEWYHNGHFPSIDEYLNMAWISSSTPLTLLHAYFCITNPIDRKELAYLQQYPGIIRSPSMIHRLTNDLATSLQEIKRGDAPSSIRCYKHDTECSEEEARHYITRLVDSFLKQMNKAIMVEKGMGVSESFCTIAMNHARIILCVYQFDDRTTKQNMVSLLVEPIPMS